MDTFTPSGIDAPESDPEAALLLLKARLGTDFSGPFRDDTDRRHDLAVLAVDLGRRLLDLTRRLSGSIDLDLVVLSRLASAVRVDIGNLSGDRPELRDLAALPVLHARAAEVDRTLRYLAVAYKQAWWIGAQADTPPS